MIKSNAPKGTDYSSIFEKKTELKDNIKENENIQIDEVEKKWNMNEKIINLFANNMEKDQKLRETYAVILIIILTIMLIALITIFVLVGLEILNYSETVLNIFVTGGIAEVYVLIRTIVKYLFKDNLTNALTIILENNNQLKKYNGKVQSKYKKDVNKKSDKPREI